MRQVAVGEAVVRPDAVAKVTGRARYTVDMEVDGMLIGRVLRSPLPHARIVRIDTRAAEALPGVYAVLTGPDLAADPGINLYYGHAITDCPILPPDKVRYEGEPVVAVAAVDAETAERALQAVDIEYEPLPFVTDVEAAIRPDAPVIHDSVQGGGKFHHLEDVPDGQGYALNNVCYHRRYAVGDLEAAFAGADEVYEDRFTFPMIHIFSLEPYSVVADFRGDEIKVWSGCQGPYILRTILADIFHVPQHRILVETPYVGGGFGGKGYPQFEPLAVALSRKARRPVKITYDMTEESYRIRRHDGVVILRTGVKRDGTFVARYAEIYLNTGATAENGPRVVHRAANRVMGPYRWQAVAADAYAVYTNTTPAGSMRAIGGPQAIWAGERQIDLIAARLGIDPVELRKKNLLQRGEHFGPVLKGRPLDADLPAHLDLLARTLQRSSGEDLSAPSVSAALSGRSAPTAGEGAAGDGRPSPLRSGRGVGITLLDSGGGISAATAVARMHADGSVTLETSSVEIGQGVHSALRQIASHTLGVPWENIFIHGPNTEHSPFDRTTASSRSTVVMGRAVMEAVLDLRRQLCSWAADVYGVDEGQVTIENGVIIAGGRRMTCGEAVRAMFGFPGGELIGRGVITPSYGDGLFALTPFFYEVALTGAEIHVDTETGEITVRRCVNIADVGRAINPQQVEAQDEGALMQGLGHTLWEQMVYEAGQLLNPSPIDYRVPRFSDQPLEWESILIQNGDGPGPYGAKGAGEAAVAAIAPAVAGALFHATGASLVDLPLTPERVWRALQGAASQKGTGFVALPGSGGGR